MPQDNLDPMNGDGAVTDEPDFAEDFENFFRYQAGESLEGDEVDGSLEPAEEENAELAQLRARNAELEAAQAAQEAGGAAFVYDPTTILTDEDIAAMTEDSTTIGTVLREALSRHREAVLRETVEITSRTMRSTAEQQAATQEFWAENADLREEGKLNALRAYATAVQGESPGMPTKQVLAEAAKRLRKDFNLHQQAQDTDRRVATGKRAGAGGRAQRTGAPVGLAKELDAMLTAGRRK